MEWTFAFFYKICIVFFLENSLIKPLIQEDKPKRKRNDSCPNENTKRAKCQDTNEDTGNDLEDFLNDNVTEKDLLNADAGMYIYTENILMLYLSHYYFFLYVLGFVVLFPVKKYWV